MCEHCGCSSPGPAHDHEHTHDHEHGGHHHHGHEGERRTIELSQSILSKNDRYAERNRGFFAAKGLAVVNLVSSPGSGKTTLLERTLRDLGRRLRMGVIVGDLATDNDARRLRQQGVQAVQITTGTACHLDAHMILHALDDMKTEGLDLLLVENVGNLVCPAAFDLGEDRRVVVTSVTEGEDKPLKYPPIFSGADLVVISKIDLADAVEFKRDVALQNVRAASPRAQILEVSAKTGAGMDRWYAFLDRLLQSKRTPARA
jgi:hydrogenase nickel incorporation protein HypB